MCDWWEENIHYYVYDPNTIYRWHDKVDTFVVAEVAIYSSDGTPKIGLYFLVTKQELLSGVTMEGAIEEAKRVIPNIVQESRARVEELAETIQVLLDWKGREMETRPVRS